MSEREYRHIIRMAGTDIDGQENLLQGITRVKGVGMRMSKSVLTRLNMDPTSRLGYLTDAEIQSIEKLLADIGAAGFPVWYVNRPKDRSSGRNLHLTGPDLEFARRTDIDRLKRIKAWRGIRHSFNVKVRGQHTRSTGRRGVAVGVSRKKE
ncbi:MAG: 30S ribosomal protein S13 [Candidatus Thorarchaeota archaeon]|nr:MAG: 30S ribosomal protein S13 [Candidatus Thorarchaeota archaeon]